MYPTKSENLTSNVQYLRNGARYDLISYYSTGKSHMGYWLVPKLELSVVLADHKKASPSRATRQRANADVCFTSPQPDASLHSDTIDMGLENRMVCPFTPQPLGQYQIILLVDRGT